MARSSPAPTTRRLLIPEVLVDGDRFAVVRPRPSYEAMLALDVIPDWLA